MAGVQEVLAERYELLEVLGRGGMGVVYRARDRVLARIVAVKVLPLDRAQDPMHVARFEREALAAAGLSHRNIVAVFDSGTDDETRFIVMEYLRGHSLAEVVHERGALGADEAVAVAAQVAAALAAAHGAGIVHRDIKPANVMLDEHGHVKVLDFGIARLTAGIALTQTATVLGSAPYLAPELSRGASADARSDIYALGCVLYELLTGRPPFTGEVPAAVVHQHLSETPRRLDEVNPAVPAALSALTMKMLDKNPDRRPQDAGELAVAMGATVIGPGPGAATGRLDASESAKAPVADEAAATTRIDRSQAATAALAADAAATLALGAGAGNGDEPTRTMPRRSTSSTWATRRFGVIAALILAVLVIALFALTGGSGPGVARGHGAKRAAAHHSTSTQTTPPTSSTAPKTAAPPVTHKPPPTKPPPVQHSGGPHGPPPGQAKKPGDKQHKKAK